MDESISVSSIIDKLPPSWKDFKHTLKHGKDDLSLVQLGSHLRIEESLRAQDSDKGKGKEVAGPSVNMIEECGKTGHFKRDCRSGNKKNANAGGSGKGSKDRSQDQGQNLVPVWNRFIKYSVSLISEAFYVQVDAIAWWIDSGLQLNVVKIVAGLRQSDPVEEVPNKRNKTTPYELWYKKRPNLSFLRVWGCRAVVRLPDPKRKTLGEKVEGSRDQVGSQYLQYYSIEEDPRTYNEAMQSRDSAFWKEAIDDEIGSIMENNTWVLSDLPPGCKPLGCKWIFKRKMKVDGTIDKFKARLVIQGFRQK
ncbi:zinc finger, CCHC-type containing protein [Tanacetum coccineum]|uniref:Zinc finger, CCHC-type containing protein n=1 Tax=Tanacetum coccineum TaxID=301880 RepID=A0ABQ5HN66_9ASTR